MGACAPLKSGYLHQIRRYLASKYRACQTLLVSFTHCTFLGTMSIANDTSVGRTERVGLMSKLMQNLASKKAKKYMLIIERNKHFFK